MLKLFKKDDRVQWDAGGGGGMHTIDGVIVAIVPPGETPFPHLPKQYRGQALRGLPFPGGAARPHKSYLVLWKAVDVGRDRIYWPRVSALRLREPAKIEKEEQEHV